MDPVIIDAGTLEFNEADLTATGLLIPYGVPARSNLGTFTFAAGDVEIPSDYTGMGLNIEHQREDVVGGFTKAWEQPEGVMSTFKYRDTPEGHKAFEDGKSGKRKHLSAEVARVRIRDGKALPGAVLFAAAQVERPAFEGATLLAAEDTTIPVPDPVQGPVTFVPDENGDIAIAATEIPQTVTVEPAEGDSVVFTPEATPAAENTDEGVTVTASAPVAPLAAGATAPGTLLASNATPKAEDIDLGTVFAAMAAVKASPGAASADAETLLAALSDIKVETSGGLTVANSGVIQPAWVGKLWQGRRYARKYIDLLTHLYGGINVAGRKGFKIDQGTALVTAWSGNKAEIGSGTATTSVFSSSRQAYGYAGDFAREWYDLEGGQEVLQAFFENVTDSYAKVTDEDALKAIFLAASKTSTALDRLVAPGTYPTQYPAAMGQLIQAIDLVSDNGDDPSFAIVNPVAWTQLLFTPKDLVPEFVEFGVGIGTGEATAGKVRVVKAAQSFFTGTTTTNPQVIAGAKPAIEFREQGETPIQVDALDILHGGIDQARIGYLETFIVRPESLALVGTKP